MRGISLPKSSAEAFDKTGRTLFKFESRIPAQGSVTEYPESRFARHSRSRVSIDR